jgi:hypothetical protein
MRKITVGTGLATAFSLIAIPVLAAGLWMGVNWNDPYGSSSVDRHGDLEVVTSSCYTTSCWGAAHYNTPSDFRAADTPWVEVTFRDGGHKKPGPQLWMEDETYGGCYGQNLGTCGAWTQFGAWQRESDGYENYRIYWWDYDTATEGWVDTGVPRKAGEHTLKLAMRADGTVDYWLDGMLVHSTTAITPNYFGDIYLAGHSAPEPANVTGGGQASSGGTDFSITVSARNDGYGNVSGQMEYSREGQSVADLSMHATVECLSFFEGGTVAVAAGPASAQNDPSGAVFTDAWMVVEIQEGGTGSGDAVRVRLLSEEDALAICEEPSGTFPGTIYDGNFNIRYSGSDSTVLFTHYQTGTDYSAP